MLSVRKLSQEELDEIYRLLDTEEEGSRLKKRAKIILYSKDGYTVQEIQRELNLSPFTVRKWIHRFNGAGVEGLYDKKPPGRPRKFGEEIRTKIEKLLRTPLRNLGLPFTNWTARALAQYLIREGIVEYIGEQTIRDILKERGITIQRRKKWINSPD